jgi:hypothetical protein
VRDTLLARGGLKISTTNSLSARQKAANFHRHQHHLPTHNMVMPFRHIVTACFTSRLVLMVLMLVSDLCIQTSFDTPNDKLVFGALKSTSEKQVCDAQTTCLPNDSLEPGALSSLIQAVAHPYSSWDAAHFLTIARDGREHVRGVANESQEDESNTRETLEARHPFLPLFPLLINRGAFLLFRRWSESDDLLPNWCYVLAGLITNNIAFAISAVALYGLTHLLLRDQFTTVQIDGGSSDKIGVSKVRQVEANLKKREET